MVLSYLVNPCVGGGGAHMARARNVRLILGRRWRRFELCLILELGAGIPILISLGLARTSTAFLQGTLREL